MNNPGSFRDNLFSKLTVFVFPNIFKCKKSVLKDFVICIYCSDTRFPDSYLVNNQSVLFRWLYNDDVFLHRKTSADLASVHSVFTDFITIGYFWHLRTVMEYFLEPFEKGINNSMCEK